MELRELSHDERLALIALIQLVMESDRRVSSDETDELDRIVEEIGEAAHRSLVEEIGTRFTTDAELRPFLETITRQDARELIYGTVLDTAMQDAVDAFESDLLDWLAKAWNVRVEFGGGEPGGG